MTRHIKSNKETLARLMSREGITVVYDNKAKTASFSSQRVLTLPVLENSEEYVYDWFIAHEVSHALHTPFNKPFMAQIDSKVLADYFNVTEDARIEKLIKLKYPGTKKDCAKFYEHFTKPEVDFFKIKNKDLTALNLIDRINLHFKIGHIVPMNFSQEEEKFVQMVDDAMTAEEALDAAKAILEYQKKQNNKQELVKIVIGGSNTEDSQDSSPGTSDEDSNTEDSDDEDSNTEDSGDDEDSGIAPETQKAFNKAMEDNASKAANKPHFNKLDTSKSSSSIDNSSETRFREALKRNNDTSLKTYNKFITNITPVVKMMVSYFNMKKKGREYQKTLISKTGKIDMGRLAEHEYEPDIFLRSESVAEAKNHGLFFLIDWSSSMDTLALPTFKQVLILIEFCRMVNIPYELYAFTSGTHLPVADNSHSVKAVSGGGVTMMKFLSSSMSKTEHKKMSDYILSSSPVRVMDMSMTPLVSAIMFSSDIIKQFQERTAVDKTIFCVLTDGGSSDTIGTASHGTIIDSMFRKHDFKDYQEAWKALVGITKQERNLHATIGFYLSRANEITGACSGFLDKAKLTRKNKEDFAKDQIFESDQVKGFDKYFFLNSSILDRGIKNLQSEMTTQEGDSSDAIENDFEKVIESKSAKNMTFLKVFIEQIS